MTGLTKKDIVAIGRYRTIVNYCKQRGLHAIALANMNLQVGIYSSDKAEKTFDCKVLDWAGWNRGRRVWYKGWAALNVK